MGRFVAFPHLFFINPLCSRHPALAKGSKKAPQEKVAAVRSEPTPQRLENKVLGEEIRRRYGAAGYVEDCNVGCWSRMVDG